MAKRPKRWIQNAIKHPGRLRRAAAKAGALTKSGKIDLAWAREVASRPGRGGLPAAARLYVNKLRPLAMRRSRRKAAKK